MGGRGGGHRGRKYKFPKGLRKKRKNQHVLTKLVNIWIRIGGDDKQNPSMHHPFKMVH